VKWKDEVYDSRKEMEYAMYLESERQAGRVKWIRRQIPVKLIVRGKLICGMRIDFKVGYPDGHFEYHEVKSAITKKQPDYVIKKKLFEALNPDTVYKVID
jgi:hypothetical protein